MEVHDLNTKDMEDAARQIALHFYRTKKIEHVYGVPRGGLVLATYLSHALNVPLLLTPVPTARHSTLVVDDIWDSGKTMRGFEGFPHRAVWVTKEPQEGIFHVLHITLPVWILFPWENKKRAAVERDNYLQRRAVESTP